jgi:hypothetical protein
MTGYPWTLEAVYNRYGTREGIKKETNWNKRQNGRKLEEV